MQRDDTGLIWGIGFSLLLHFGCFGFFSLTSHSSSKTKAEIITAVLVRKGETRDPKLLPRIHQAPKAAKPAKKIVKQKSKKTKRPRKRIDIDDVIRRAEKKIAKYRRDREPDDPRADKTPPPGQKDGSKYGTVSRLELARLGSMYGLKLRNKIEAHLHIPPFFNEEQTRTLKKKIQIILYLHNSGHLRNVSLGRTSGDSRFDNAILTAVRRASPYPKPPGKILSQIQDGIEIGW